MSLTSLSNLGVIFNVNRSSVMKEKISVEIAIAAMVGFSIFENIHPKEAQSVVWKCGSEELMFGSVLARFLST